MNSLRCSTRKRTNALAYFATASLRTKKGFLDLTPGIGATNPTVLPSKGRFEALPYHKTFYGRNLRIFIIRYSVCAWQAFPA